MTTIAYIGTQKDFKAAGKLAHEMGACAGGELTVVCFDIADPYQWRNVIAGYRFAAMILSPVCLDHPNSRELVTLISTRLV